MRAEHDVDLRRLVDDLLLFHLREAAADGDLHALVLALATRELAEVAIELGGRVLTNGAGVDDDDVGVFGVGLNVARSEQRASDALGVVHVHLAAERAHVEAPGRAIGVAGGVGRSDSGGRFSHDSAILPAGGRFRRAHGGVHQQMQKGCPAGSA